MGFSFKNLLPAIGMIAGNAIAPGIGTAIGGAIGSGIAGGSATKRAVSGIQDQDRQAYANYLRAARPNQTNASGATSAWNQDSTGNWSQKVALGPEEQKRRDLYNQMMAGRMQQASGMDMSRYNQGMDFSSNPRLSQYQQMAGGIRQPGSLGGSALLGG